MSVVEYLKSLLEDQKVTDNDTREMENDRDRIERAIFEIEGLPKPTPYYGGSRGKRTMIRDSYDLDIVFAYPSDDQQSNVPPLKELYYVVLKQLVAKRFNPQQKNVAIRVVKRDDYHIDVVPGKRISNNEDNLFIFRSKTKESLKTSVKKHIESVSESQHRDVLKLLKLWKVRNNVDFPSFVLEQCAIKSLETTGDSFPLNELIIMAWEFIANQILYIQLKDPANPSNIITSDEVVSLGEKRNLYDLAKWSLEQDNLSNLNGWQIIFRKKDPQVPFQSSGTPRPRLSADSPGTRFA